MREWDTVVTSYATQMGESQVVRGLPHPALRPAVTGYLGYRAATGKPVRRLLFPHSHVIWLFDFDVPRRWLPDGREIRRSLRVPVTPVHDRVLEFVQRGAHTGVGVAFAPVAAFTVMDVAMADFASSRVDLVDVLGRPTRTLADRLASADGWPARFAILDEFLLNAFLARPAVPAMTSVAWRRLKETKGALTVRSLADELGVTTRTLELRFRREIGVSPKTAARILRFEQALPLLTSRPTGGLTRIAHECGYADQAHFAREVRALTNRTPTELRTVLRPHPLATTSS
ncbi:AraC family transcriptional regulator [Kibdelosporangium lantanae]